MGHNPETQVTETQTATAAAVVKEWQWRLREHEDLSCISDRGEDNPLTSSVSEKGQEFFIEGKGDHKVLQWRCKQKLLFHKTTTNAEISYQTVVVTVNVPLFCLAWHGHKPKLKEYFNILGNMFISIRWVRWKNLHHAHVWANVGSCGFLAWLHMCTPLAAHLGMISSPHGQHFMGPNASSSFTHMGTLARWESNMATGQKISFDSKYMSTWQINCWASTSD